MLGTIRHRGPDQFGIYIDLMLLMEDIPVKIGTRGPADIAAEPVESRFAQVGIKTTAGDDVVILENRHHRNVPVHW